ncbi:twin-arginine translocase subunit TatC, partial [Cohnella sp. GbtcB17]|uniref:twin-arginine translocase subunit TatC n=1 Tax=Cohnella sp. GbtcB17 TaxID=2824762 RepID=UPI001C307220
NVFSPWDAVGIWMKLAFMIGLPVSLPFALYHLWAYVRPGLRPEERKSTVKYIPYSILVFVAGFAFAYFVVFPMAFQFATDMTRNMGLHET